MKAFRVAGSLLVRACALAALLAGVAQAQDAYPSRPVRIIVPFPAGGGTDTVTRILAQKIQESVKQSVIVENKAGVLSRVSGLFTRRGYNIFSLAVSPTEDERYSRMTVVVDGESAPIEQVTKQLNKLIPVIEIVLALIFLVHIFKTVTMYLGNQQARPVAYQVKKSQGAPSRKSLSSTTMIISGLWLLLFVPGWIAWSLISLWFLYRIVKGMIRMNDGRPMEPNDVI